MFDWIRKLRAPSAERKLMAWHALGRPAWPMRDQAAFAREGYGRNAIAYRCVRLIAEAAASAPFKVTPHDHPLARLLARPNPEQTGIELMEAFYGHLQVSGNAYLEAASIEEAAPPLGTNSESYRLEVLDGPDVIRALNVAGPSFLYTAADQTADFGVLPGSLHFRVAQIGDSGATGLNSELTITL